MPGNAVAVQRVWNRRSSEQRKAIMKKVRAGLERPDVRETMAQKRAEWWKRQTPCLHCGAKVQRMQRVDGLEGAVECINVKRCEQRIVKSWGKVA